MHKTVAKLIQHYNFDIIPIEGTLYKSTYVSPIQNADAPLSTAILGLYAHEPKSHSTFHKLQQDEVWHFYGGDAFYLHLIYPNGKYQKIVMGTDIKKDEKVQFVIPANVWQAGELSPKGTYALFGCTLSPGFTGNCFEGGNIKTLLEKFPQHAAIIQQLGVKGTHINLPDGYQQ